MADIPNDLVPADASTVPSDLVPVDANNSAFASLINGNPVAGIKEDNRSGSQIGSDLGYLIMSHILAAPATMTGAVQAPFNYLDAKLGLPSEPNIAGSQSTLSPGDALDTTVTGNHGGNTALENAGRFLGDNLPYGGAKALASGGLLAAGELGAAGTAGALQTYDPDHPIVNALLTAGTGAGIMGGGRAALTPTLDKNLVNAAKATGIEATPAMLSDSEKLAHASDITANSIFASGAQLKGIDAANKTANLALNNSLDQISPVSVPNPMDVGALAKKSLGDFQNSLKAATSSAYDTFAENPGAYGGSVPIPTTNKTIDSVITELSNGANPPGGLIDQLQKVKDGLNRFEEEGPTPSYLSATKKQLNALYPQFEEAGQKGLANQITGAIGNDFDTWGKSNPEAYAPLASANAAFGQNAKNLNTDIGQFLTDSKSDPNDLLSKIQTPKDVNDLSSAFSGVPNGEATVDAVKRAKLEQLLGTKVGGQQVESGAKGFQFGTASTLFSPDNPKSSLINSLVGDQKDSFDLQKMLWDKAAALKSVSNPSQSGNRLANIEQLKDLGKSALTTILGTAAGSEASHPLYGLAASLVAPAFEHGMSRIYANPTASDIATRLFSAPKAIASEPFANSDAARRAFIQSMAR